MTQMLTATRPRSARVIPRATSRVRTGGADWILIGVTVALLGVSSLLVWSATSTEADPTAYLKRHLVNIAIGSVLMVMVVATDHRWVRILTPLVYLGSVVGLALVLAMGTTVNGSRSWLMVGGLSVQPAEFAKLAVVIGMALLVAERAENSRGRYLSAREVLLMIAIGGVPAGLILLQPDLGTVLVLVATVFGVLVAAGAPRRWLVAMLAGGAAAAVAAVQLQLLKPYQIDRFLAFTDPSLDPRGAGYNTIQARIAIGNGGVFGQGLFEGSQTRSGFVPEQHTDFIFTVAGEELGLVGAGVVLGLLGLLIWRALMIAWSAHDMFGRVAAAGIACWLGFQTFQNVGMCLGIMPVTGVPLPLVSYGGSAVFATMMAVGLLQNIHLRSASAMPGRRRTFL